MSVVPYLTIPGGRAAEAATFYMMLFGATEGTRMPAEDNKRLLHCALHFAGATLYLSDDFHGRTTPAMSAVFVGLDTPAQVDALIENAKRLGATVTRPPEDMFWGDRFAEFTDPFGHSWQAGAPKG
ncbi:MAG TPA: glyoxalase/bleomycin resistance/extradiol dioxygenase family protein [Rhizomicrobium sp.]|jgi:PhnB protein|nr:glyoxalase/bleomycin resistance/extradiol dioxygenase family protein [Rhizomicrobium sp.]